jgi:hypothetical protein
VGICAEDLVVGGGTQRAIPGKKVTPQNAAAARAGSVTKAEGQTSNL